MVSSARARYLRVGPRKLRDIADLIRGLSVARAEQQLSVTHRPSAAPMIKRLLKSAVSNANHEVEKTFSADELIVGQIFVDSGPMQRRFRPAPMGRALPIRKRSAHVTIQLHSHPEK